MMPNHGGTTFFTAATGPYRDFIVPYIYSVTHHNEDAFVELMVDSPDDFAAANAAALSFLDSHRYHLRPARFSGSDGLFMRFLIEPTFKGQYVYIGDVDILVLERGITLAHVANAKTMNLPYSNIQRKGRGQLGGLHFSEWEAYYPIALPAFSVLQRCTGDQELVSLLVQERGWPLPASDFRPQHGIHMSPNRSEVIAREDGPANWGVSVKRWQAYQAFAESSQWRELVPLLSPSYREMVRRLESEAGREFGRW